jgi:threonylcarbamoyladenosine tRNA methylthiotransferase MtaB
MNFFLTTLGCRLNEAESAEWGRSLESKGHQLVASAAAADVFVINTCAVTAQAARKSRKLISRLKRENPRARSVVTGCYVTQASVRFEAIDLVVKNGDKDALVETIVREFDIRDVARTLPDASPFPKRRTRAFVKVQDGCRNRCAFCIVTVLRGDERSRPIADVVRQVQALCADGTREIVLTGVHLGGYGTDLGTDLTELVRAVLTDTDVVRLRLSSLEPWDLPPGFGRSWQNPRLLPHLHLPLQSGSDSVLKRMARRTNTRSFRALLADLRGDVPRLSITTDWIVGYPGETQAEHQDSVAFIESMQFADVHVFPYSRRAGTRAARLPDPVAEETQRARVNDALELALALRRKTFTQVTGESRAVLWERPGVVDDSGRRHYFGYTEDYLPVETWSPQHLQNHITQTVLRRVSPDSTCLLAEE